MKSIDMPFSAKMDESTGKPQMHISFPVLDGKKPIGSMVIGLDLSKLSPKVKSCGT
jgi:hypothetical protein